MSNNAKPLPELIGRRVRHDFSTHAVGEITAVRDEIRGYCYYVKWSTDPERSDWYALTSLRLED